MALSFTPVTFAQGIVAASGTSVGPTNGGNPAPVPENCHTIWVTNPAGGNIGLVGWAAPPAALTAGVNGQRVEPGKTAVFPVGTSRDRGIMDQAQLAGSGMAFDSIGGALTLEVTYFNVMGSVE